jgi:protein-tyrosine phosphatase
MLLLPPGGETRRFAANHRWREANPAARVRRYGQSVERFIVDIHSHLVPSGDDGARTLEEGLVLLADAARHETRTIYATPHAHSRWDSYPLTPERLELFERMLPAAQARCARFGLTLERGFELYPGALPPEADLRDYQLGATGCLLIELPGSWTGEPEPCALTYRQAEEAERAGLLPVLAHPERCLEFAADPAAWAELFRSRGWRLCLNGASPGGGHGRDAQRAAWALLDAGLVDLVASDAHNQARPAQLDALYRLLAERYGSERIRPLFDGSALQADAAERAA